jgi:signal transduction histidine kinase
MEAAQIASVGTFTILTVGGIGTGTVLACFVFLRWNRKLGSTVELRTAELRRSNDELKMKDIAQIDFINAAAEELKASIRPLLGIIELMGTSMRKSMSENGKETIEISGSELKLLDKNAKRLTELTANILDVTSIENLNETLGKETIDLGKDIQETIDEISTKYGGTSKIVYFPPIESLMIEGDGDRLEQVVSNLIDNAIKFASKSRLPSVVVSVRKEGNYAQVKIMDDGPGIDSELMSKLFTRPFLKSESGTGLGLYISKLIVEVHGGKIWAENNEGVPGSSFIFDLPLAEVKLEKEKKSEERKFAK